MSKPEVLAEVVRKVHEDYPQAVVAGTRDGYFDAADSGEVAAQIRAAAADMLFLGMTSPKKEIFLKDWGDTLGVPVLHGVGGSFDVMAGVTRRAPEYLQRVGLEWFYRFMQEPGRMWKRYLFTNSAFIRLTLAERRHPTPRYVLRRRGSR